MKKIFQKTVAALYGAKIHVNHTAIKGKKSGGVRDSNGVDWKDGSKEYGAAIN